MERVFKSGKQSKSDQRVVIKFLTAQHLRPIDIWVRLRRVHGVHTLCQASVHNWCRKFEANPDLTILDQPRAGCPRFARTQRKIREVGHLLREDSRRSIHELSLLTNVSMGTVHRIITKELKMCKITSRFVPRVLTDEQKQRRVAISQANLDKCCIYE